MPHFFACRGGLFCALALLAVSLTASGVRPSAAQINNQPSADENNPAAVTYGAEVLTRMRIGAVVKARGAAAHRIQLVVPTPLECPEQSVEVIEDEVSPAVSRADYRVLNEGSARQIVIEIPELLSGQDARAVVTYEIRTRVQLPPQDTAGLRIPTRIPPQLKRYLGPSPFIEVNHRKIRDAVREALAKVDAAKDESKTPELQTDVPQLSPLAAGPGAAPSAEGVSSKPSPTAPAARSAHPAANAAVSPGEPASGGEHVAAGETQADSAAAARPLTDWQRVEALYDYAREHVTYEEGDDKTAVQVLKEGRGDCQAISGLFIAMCRTAKAPARTVWVDQHQYAEFYLEDAQGVGHWYPVESAGARAFGSMPTARVILQKGDNFRVPERRREVLRYPSNYFKFDALPNAQPKVSFIMERL